MLESLGLAVQDVATVVVLFLPGFIAVSLFELTTPQIARDRPALLWALWSLAASLFLFSAVHGVFRVADWPREPLDPQFHLSLLTVGGVLGYAAGRLAGTETGRKITKRLKVLIPPWVWVEVLASRNYVVVHLTDGTRLFGYPRRYTDDPREQVREVYLEQPMVLALDPQSGQEEYVPLPQAQGLLVDSTKIQFIQVLDPASDEQAS